MLSVVLILIPGTFAFLFWHAYRKGKDYVPPEGAERW